MPSASSPQHRSDSERFNFLLRWPLHSPEEWTLRSRAYHLYGTLKLNLTRMERAMLVASYSEEEEM